MRASEYHKTTARFHGQLAKLHQDHFDGLDDGDPHASFHKPAADLHARPRGVPPLVREER
jgi:hypothetical protein